LLVGSLFFILGTSGQVAAFLIRWRLAERIPLANLYESMAAAALLASLVAVLVETVISIRTGRSGRPSLVQGSLALAASLFGCIIVMAQAFLERHDINAFISPAMPILSEFWLRVHTSCIVASYGLIGMGGLMSVVYLAMRVRLPWDDARALTWDRTTFAMNAAATVVLWAGLVLGAVWAAVSWGRPWGWDPKEVFALLTWVVFIMLIHLRHAVRTEHRGLATALVSLAAFLVMGFNWYFVNVKLAGLHSYA
jgi:ABC-type transport system involved in cytochrome c biogenesis permease subunit